jgi:hypothetical protein
MNRLIVVVIAVLAFGLVALPAAGQDSTPPADPGSRSCRAPLPARDMPSAAFGTPIAETATLAAAELDEALFPPPTPPPGVPATAAVLERIRAAEERLADCFRAGDYLAFTSLFTPKALYDGFGITSAGETPAHSVGYVFLREELLSVSEAQTHADGRVSADVVFAFEGYRMRARDVFIEADGGLLLDEVVELGIEPAPPGTPTTSLDEEMLQSLSIHGFPPGETPSMVAVGSLGATIALQPGATIGLHLGQFNYEICGTGNRCFVPLPVAATWTVTPASGARIDRASGTLTIDAATPSGSVFTVSADIADGRRVVITEVYTFTPEANPLIGAWREEAQRACGTGEEVAPNLPIQELVFSADGTFAVTWLPFESYVDYWGTYTFDLSRGTLDLMVSGGNMIPADVDERGSFSVDASGHLILTDMWLGSPERESGAANCGHRFVG